MVAPLAQVCCGYRLSMWCGSALLLQLLHWRHLAAVRQYAAGDNGKLLLQRAVWPVLNRGWMNMQDDLESTRAGLYAVVKTTGQHLAGEPTVPRTDAELKRDFFQRYEEGYVGKRQLSGKRVGPVATCWQLRDTHHRRTGH